MTTFVTGATSQLGYFLLPQLIARGEAVVALSRRAQPAHGAEMDWRVGDIESLGPLATPPSRIVSFGPLPGLAGWLRRAGPIEGARLVAVSSMSAESKRASPVAAERHISQVLRDAEAAVAQECERRGIAWTVLRPTLVYGAGLDRNFTPLVHCARRWRVFPLPRARGLRQPVHAQDVASAALAALDTPVRDIVPIGGGERLTVAETYSRVRASIGVATLGVAIPAVAARCAPLLPPALQGALSRLDQDLVADNSRLQASLGITPRGFAPDAACWRTGP